MGSSKFINQEIKMYYLVRVVRDSMAVHLTRMIVKGSKKRCMSSAMDGTDDTLWNGSEEDGIVRCVCEEDEGTDL